ncbi:hypothetical protein GCM10023238_16830 [Streptomyces heliomycini]
MPDADITVIGNTGDDIHLFGLKVCPDLDTVMYTLGGGINEEQGWGRTDETFHLKEELAAYGVGPEWFGLGDRDFATHIVRTQMLGAGFPLSAVTEALCDTLGARRAPHPDDRRPRGDPCGGHVARQRLRRGVRRTQGGPLPGVLGAAAGLGAGRGGRAGRRGAGESRRRASWRRSPRPT